MYIFGDLGGSGVMVPKAAPWAIGLQMNTHYPETIRKLSGNDILRPPSTLDFGAAGIGYKTVLVEP